ncbi:hypothetical protein ATE92_1906 [Ulvibacter sp. MAR_2010_11]|uniref:hypothetical protein n=1 Tax=Ulvibacter sp. MAR_2010_11 TaxID=1250229 RepID=UPI000C2CA3E2|nr:hypothetical protein [Ulvibacter sp. MAR_2010_11]PKA83740.1 hypothetical protein ATE92_1906 [Ulvibacter sp. MAR_2010_11]
MKKIQAILLATVLLVGAYASAATIPTSKMVDPTTAEIRGLLTDANFIVEVDTSAFVTFMLNREGEIVVLSVDTDNDRVASFIKARLNYHKVKAPLEKGKEYKVPVLLQAEA